ncbi:gas vesicle protein K [Streptomyces sp. NPDC059740]|uniref:gas vesicle protein K n=1 Tax=Streptomyces sp. NPDC059740 TaxID=3346926 RepID=UPI0036639A65
MRPDAGQPAPPEAAADGGGAADTRGAPAPGDAERLRPAFDLLPAAAAGLFDDPQAAPGSAASRLSTDPDTVERDLIKLVLTIVELLRQLMERTALHRVDQEDLTEDQEERIGLTLMILKDRMTELCDRYGLTMEDLNLDLGPLGSLLPRD